MERLLRLGSALIVCLAAVACDGPTTPTDAGVDGSGPNPCAGAADGDACGSGLICLSSACVASTCGDGYVDEAAGEACEDGNDVAFDGCEPESCTFTCTDDTVCDDGEDCTGAERCNELHACEAGTPLAAGAACTRSDDTAGVCRAAQCVDAGCGNSVVDGGEECDDGNEVDGDGCDVGCTFSCETDEECNDGTVCTGTETCDTATHTCQAGEPLDCDDSSACTADSCDAALGCQNVLIDGDGDGHASEDLGSCGDDCDDARADVHPGHQELCDDVDHDCNGTPVPEETALWYLDCDGDGFAALGAPSERDCEEPAPTSCGGGWTTRIPVVGNPATQDCNDADPDARPNQSGWFTSAATGGGFDYNCSGATEHRYGTTVGVDPAGTCVRFCPPRLACTCIGGSGWTSASVPACGNTSTYSTCGAAISGGCARSNASRRNECH